VYVVEALRRKLVFIGKYFIFLKKRCAELVRASSDGYGRCIK